MHGKRWFSDFRHRKCQEKKTDSEKNLQKECIILHGTALNFFHGRNSPCTSFCCNSTRTLEFQNTFIQTFPRNSSSQKNHQSSLLIPNLIKSPTCSKKQINFFCPLFSTIHQRTCRNKNVCKSSSLKYCSQRESRNPYRNHMTSHNISCSWRRKNAISPERCSPSNSSVTLKVPSQKTSDCQNTQGNHQKKTLSWNTYVFFLCSIWCIKNSEKNSKAISTCKTSNCHLNQMSICRKGPRRSPRKFQNCIFTIVSCQKGPSQKA